MTALLVLLFAAWGLVCLLVGSRNAKGGLPDPWAGFLLFINTLALAGALVVLVTRGAGL